ncbi:MAG: SoxR reducing system RseC family protein [Brevinematia bacterium]
MYRKGIVVSNKNGRLIVRITSEEEAFCDKCDIRGICNQNRDERLITLNIKKQLAEGSPVSIRLNEGFAIVIAFLIFILPLLIFIASILVLQSFFGKGLSYTISALILIVYFIIIAIFQKRLVSFIEISEIRK